MAPERRLIGVDVGTGSARAGVFDAAGQLRAAASRPIAIWHDEGGVVEQSSADIWAAVCAAVRKAVARAGIGGDSVAGIGFDATCSMVVLGAGGVSLPVGPSGDPQRDVIVWMDHRAIDQADRINAGGHAVLRDIDMTVRRGEIVTVLGPKGWVLILVVGLTHAPRTARVMRSAAVGVVGEDYVLASHMYAVPQWRILIQDILPNVTGPLMVELGLRMTYSIGALASLSFLGLGMQPPTADWGLMINENRIALAVQPWGVLLPVLAIAVLTVGTNLIADGIAAASAGGSSVVEEDLEGIRAGAQGAAPAGGPAVPESEASTGSATASASGTGSDAASSPEEGRR